MSAVSYSCCCAAPATVAGGARCSPRLQPRQSRGFGFYIPRLSITHPARFSLALPLRDTGIPPAATAIGMQVVPNGNHSDRPRQGTQMEVMQP
jgi:hypothetical protein